MPKRISIATSIVLITLITGYSPVSVARAETCINLSKDLKPGQSDSSLSGPIRELQNYLKSLGYLQAVPNGYFGPATKAAVKAYQNINNISMTGTVGPLTRASISTKSCAQTISTTQTSATAGQTTTTIGQTTVASSEPTPVVTITSPSVGQVLAVGSSTIIRWNNTPSSIYDISLEKPGGLGAGFIATARSPGSGSDSYVWKVGTIISATRSTVLEPGTYRVRLQNSNYGSAATDPVSGWFTITGSTFGVSSIMPSSAFADEQTSIVLYGSGFTTSSSIYFDSDYSNLRGNIRYVSPDSAVLVFTLPSGLSSGPHTLYIRDGISSTPVTKSFTVLSI